MPSIFTLEGPKLRPVPCDPRSVDPEQLRIGTLVEMEHTKDPAAARIIALHHLCENAGAPYYIPGTGVKHERLLLNGAWSRIPTWLLVGLGAAAVVGAVCWYRRGSAKGLRGLSPQDIARESKTAEDYARRIEAWNSSEAKPIPVEKLAKLYPKAKPATIKRLIHEAREAREEGREQRWLKMEKGLRGYRVAYGSSGGGKTFRVFDDSTFDTVEGATKRMRAYKRQGLWTWVEDEQGNFVPVPGAKSERARKAYPLR